MNEETAGPSLLGESRPRKGVLEAENEQNIDVKYATAMFNQML